MIVTVQNFENQHKQPWNSRLLIKDLIILALRILESPDKITVQLNMSIFLLITQ